ncbi:MAG: DUF1761 domain-containing protein [Phaeodactylibacter sp.]|nr:DUF1761 domain-containing protein [Phaeodactylibacter sp.]MCB9285859.1 DUF1761 domain-containing protein [Lewinellaceae bacterium]
MKRLKFNHLAIWSCVVLSQIVPLVWYSIFEDRWMTLNNLTAKYIEANQSSWLFVTSILGGVVSMYVLAWIFRRLPVESGRAGLITGLIIGAAFNMISLITINMFSFRPVELAVIDGGANVLIYALAGLVLGAWRKYEILPRGKEEREVSYLEEAEAG